LFFWNTNFMYVGKGLQTATHEHHAIQLITNLQGEFELQSKLWGSNTFKAVLIDSDKPHECITDNDTMLILNIAPESNIGVSLRAKYLLGQGFRSMDSDSTRQFVGQIQHALGEGIDEKNIVKFTEAYLFGLAGLQMPVAMDDRIKKVLAIINGYEGGIIKIKELAGAVFMSPSRLIHLFTQQVGVPVRKYILWRRVVKAIQCTFQNNNITQAALEAGFSDAPHFNKTIKRMFGLNLSSLKNSQFIQAWWV